MGIVDQFRHYATEIAQRAHMRVAECDRKLAQLETERVAAQAQRDAASDAVKRVLNYPVKLGADYLCPECWISRGAQIPLRPVPSNTNDDLFRCEICNTELVIER